MHIVYMPSPFCDDMHMQITFEQRKIANYIQYFVADCFIRIPQRILNRLILFKNKPFKVPVLILLLCFANSNLPAKSTTALEAENAVTGWLQLDAKPLGAPLGNKVDRVETFTDESD